MSNDEIEKNFELPKHGNREECVDEYEEEISDTGEVIRHDVVPTKNDESFAVAPLPQNDLSTFKDACKIQTHFNTEGRKVTKMKARKSAWVHNIIYLDGKKFDFSGRDYLMPIYDTPDKEILLKTARQVEKSTFLGNNLAVLCSIQPFFKCLYVSPSHSQTRQFSNEKLKTVLEGSPLIRRYLQDSRVSSQVFEKSFTNGSFIFLRSAFLSADRARGISADMLCIDEFQDILISNVPVMAQCLSHSKHGYHLYTGTPKSFDNTIEVYWETSTMTEWMVPCTHCSSAVGHKWNFLDAKNIGKNGPICKYCGKPINTSRGQWQISKNSRLKGYRIPQLMVPWIAQEPDQWNKLLYNFENYPESQFYNEVLGLSYDNASKPVTRSDVLQNCQSGLNLVDPYNLKGTPADAKLVHKMVLFAGIDWGEGNDGAGKDIMGKIKTASYTVLTIGGYVGGKRFRVVYMKRYTGKEVDPEFVVPDIIKICTNMGVKMIGTDWGHGWGVNNRLFRMYGPKRCAQFMYVDRQKEVRKWDPVGYKIQLLRNHVMSEVFYQFKEGQFLFPPLEHWETFAKDMFNISTEYVEYTRQIRYVHRPSDPDDWFHSLLYCKQVAEMYFGRYTSQ